MSVRDVAPKLTLLELRNTAAYKTALRLRRKRLSKGACLAELDGDPSIREGLLPGQLGQILDAVYNNTYQGIELSEEDLVRLEQENLKRHFESDFNFLDKHRGLRPGEIHTLMAFSGDGKSTLTKSIAVELARFSPCLIYLSEEVVSTYARDLNRISREKLKGEAEVALGNIIISSETDYNEFNPDRRIQDWADWMRCVIEKHEIKTLVLDNFSTSMFGDLSPYEQSEAFKAIKHIANEYDVAVFINIHPAKGALGARHEYEFKGDHVRGSVIVSNASSYIYGLHSVTNLEGPRKAILKTIKSRHHNAANNYYELIWRSGSNTVGWFDKDICLNPEDARKILKDNNDAAYGKKPGEK